MAMHALSLTQASGFSNKCFHLQNNGKKTFFPKLDKDDVINHTENMIFREKTHLGSPILTPGCWV